MKEIDKQNNKQKDKFTSEMSTELIRSLIRYHELRNRFELSPHSDLPPATTVIGNDHCILYLLHDLIAGQN